MENYIILIYLLAPFIVKNFLKNLLLDPRVMMCNGPKWPISPNEIIFRKPVNEPCFFYLCLSTCQKSKSDINLGHVYMRPEVNANWFEISNRFEMSFRFHGNLHRDFTAASFQTIGRPYCTCANDIF